VGADFAGLNWYNYLTRPQSRIRFRVPATYASQLAPGLHVKLYSSKYDLTKDLDIDGIEFDETPGSWISGVTR
jgi:hypothetical protein